MAIDYELNPPLTSAALNALFSAGRDEPDTSDWAPVLARSLAYIAAFDQGRLIGFVNIAGDGRDHAFLLDPRVDPTFRRRGIGSRLVALAADAARAAGCEWLHVDYEPHVAPFYAACGFRATPAGLIRLK